MLEENQLTLKLVLRFLRDNHYYEAMLQLEKECGSSYQRYSKEVEFFRRMLMEGNYPEVMSFIAAFENKLSERDYRRIMFELCKQRLYELVENPNEEELKDLLDKDIVNYCSEDDYHSLFYFLTLKNMREHPKFETWTPVVGRMNCFEFIRPYIELIDPAVKSPHQYDTLRLEDAVKEYLAAHRVQSRHEDPSSHREQRQKYKYLEKLNIQEQLQQRDRIAGQQPVTSYKLDGQRNVVSFGRENNAVPQDSAREGSEQQNDSVVYPDAGTHENFTFSEGQEQKQKSRRELDVKRAAFCTDSKAIRVARFRSKGDMLAIGTLSSCVKIYDVSGLQDEDTYRPQELEPIYEINDIHQKSVFFLDWSSKSDTLVSCSNDQTIKLTKFESGFSRHISRVIGKHDAPVRMVKFDYSGTVVVSCSEDATIGLWDVERAKNIKMLKGHSFTVNAVRWAESERNNLVVSVGRDYTVRLWDSRSGECSIVSEQFPSEIMYIADQVTEYLSQGPEYCVSHKNGTVSMVDRYLRMRSNLELHTQEVRSVEYSSLLERFVTASFDGRLCLFDEEGSSPFYMIHNQGDDSDNVVYAGFSPEGSIASCSRMGLCNIYIVS